MAGVLKTLFDRTLNSVWFGIGMMLLVAAYVAVGSGFPGVREAFEMDELAFFQAWPLKVLMGLLVANLVTVTFVRIPLTVPRLGVWMIHTGIVTLIWGMAFYYSHKEEGRAFVPKGETVSFYYDNWDRALFVRPEGTRLTADGLLLDGLPRFKSYPTLDKAKLKGLEPVIEVPGSGNGEEGQVMALGRALGLQGKLELDVEGYWPYAEIRSEFAAAAAGGGQSAVKVWVGGPRSGAAGAPIWLYQDDAGDGSQQVGPLELEQRRVETDAAAMALGDAVKHVHTLEVNGEKLEVEVGDHVKTAGGYELTIEKFQPDWRTMQGEVVPLLTFLVQPLGGKELFRRQVIPGRERVTDWKLDPKNPDEMGERQKDAMDPSLVTRYTFNDALGLLPKASQGAALGDMGGKASGSGRLGGKWIFITSPTKTWVLNTSLSKAAKLDEVTGGKGEEEFGGGAKVRYERVDGIERREWVAEVPKGQRERMVGEMGIKQVLAVRVRLGGWEKRVFVPYQQWAVSAPWEGGDVMLPGGRKVQLAMGQRVRPIAPDMKTGRAAAVTLDGFEVKSYDGGSATSGMQRDFISTLTIKEGNGHERTGKAFMNNPIYFGGTPGLDVGDTYWTLFQAQWDPNGQRFTVLGVGNRPGVWVMSGGAILMVTGLMYAFYVKPLIISARKKRALAEAEAKGKLPPGGGKARRPVVVEGVEGRVSV